MPYQSIENVPKYVPEKYRRACLEVFNYAWHEKFNTLPEEQREARSFRYANGTIKDLMKKSDNEIARKNDNGGGPVIKVDDSKHVIMGVVYDPYTGWPDIEDTQNEYITPSDLEDLCHAFMMSDRAVDVLHPLGDNPNLIVVENYLERYPTPRDREAAMSGLEHDVYEYIIRDKDGDPVDVWHSGAWIAAVKVLDNEIWQQIISGRLGAFSLEGLAQSIPVNKSDICPKVRNVIIRDWK